MSVLRPQFTQTLLETLKKESVNVHGDYGQGQSRLLEDLSQLAKDQGFIVLLVDMKRWAEHYDGMISELSRQIRAQLPAVTEPIKELAELVKALDNQAATTTVLFILQQFDALLDNAVHLDDKYKDFFPHLNSLRNQQNRVLLTITAKPYNQYRVYVDQIHNTSPLDLELLELRSLSYNEIKTELYCRVSDYLTNDYLSTLTRDIHSHPQAFEFLKYCVKQIEIGYDRELNTTKQLEIWRKKFKNGHKQCFWRKSDKVRNKLTMIIKEVSAFKVLLGSLAVGFTVLIASFDKVKPLAISVLQFLKVMK